MKSGHETVVLPFVAETDTVAVGTSRPRSIVGVVALVWLSVADVPESDEARRSRLGAGTDGAGVVAETMLADPK